MYVSNISIVDTSNVVPAEPGDRVEADEAIAQIETDKVSNNYLICYLHFFIYLMVDWLTGFWCNFPNTSVRFISVL